MSQEAYWEGVHQVIDFLGGKYETLMKELEDKMNHAAEELEFEEAIRYRELIQSVKHVAQKQKITDSTSTDDRDVIAMAQEGRDAIVQVFFVREGKTHWTGSFSSDSGRGG